MTGPTTDKMEQYPSGEDLQSQIGGRHRTGSLWRTMFLLSTIVAIVVLTVLLLNIINQSFGLTAVQEEMPEQVLVQGYFTEQILSASNVEFSEDDQKLANNIGAVANSTGFFGYTFYGNNTDKLKALSVDGVAPSSETANSGEYPLTRPLYIYTTQEILNSKPEVAAFVSYYLENVDDFVEAVGYFCGRIRGNRSLETSGGRGFRRRSADRRGSGRLLRPHSNRSVAQPSSPFPALWPRPLKLRDFQTALA